MFQVYSSQPMGVIRAETITTFCGSYTTKEEAEEEMARCLRLGKVVRLVMSSVDEKGHLHSQELGIQLP